MKSMFSAPNTSRNGQHVNKTPNDVELRGMPRYVSGQWQIAYGEPRELDDIDVENSEDMAEDHIYDLVDDALALEEKQQIRALRQLTVDYRDSLVPWLGLCWAAPNDSDRLKYAEEGIRHAQKFTDPSFVREYEGRFWTVPETRNYMMLLSSKIRALHCLRRTEESLAVCEVVLRLDPLDHMGTRGHMLIMLLERGQRHHLQRAGDIIAMFPEESASEFAWTKLWYLIITKSPWDSIVAAYNAARSANAYIDELLANRLPTKQEFDDLLDREPGFVLGGFREAWLYLEDIGRVWSSWPELRQALKKLRKVGDV